MNLKDLQRRWRALTHHDELDQELDEELRFHLDRQIEQNIKNGMTPEDARYAALKSFSRVPDASELHCTNCFYCQAKIEPLSCGNERDRVCPRALRRV